MSKKIIDHLIESIPFREHNHRIHYSGIYKNGKPLFIGSNHLRNVYNGECTCFSTHAEMDVLHKVLKGYTNQPFKEMLNLMIILSL